MVVLFLDVLTDEQTVIKKQILNQKTIMNKNHLNQRPKKYSDTFSGTAKIHLTKIP